MTEFMKPPTDNFYKFGTVASVGLAVFCIVVAFGALSQQQKQLLLWLAFAVGCAGALVFGYLWATRTQKYQDMRERGGVASAAGVTGSMSLSEAKGPPVEPDAESDEPPGFSTLSASLAAAEGLPELPAFYETTIMNGFGVILWHYWAHYVNGKPMLEIWLHALNFTDASIPISLVSVPDFRINAGAGSQPIVFEGEIQNAKTGLRIGPRRYKVIRVVHPLTAERVIEFRNVKAIGDNNASMTIAIDGFRAPLPYVMSSLGINGTIDLGEEVQEVAAD
jgi:hypothetical protein